MSMNIVVTITLMISQAAISCLEAQPPTEYDKYQTALDRLKKAERYREAVDLVKSTRNGFPGMDFRFSRELANLYRQAGDLVKCMDVWEAGHAKGYFYCLHPGIPVYAPFSKLDRFQELSKADLDLRSMANKLARMTYRMVLPESPPKERPLPLIMILHGGGSNIETEMLHWKSPFLKDSCLTAFVQSHRRFDYDTYGWSGGDTLAMKGLLDIYERIASEHPVDPGRVALAGISAGALVAMEASFEGKMPVSGFLGLCPDVEPEKFDRASVEKAAQRGLSGIIICGERDSRLDNQRKTSAMLTESGFRHRLTVIPGLGHWYPEKLPDILDSALDEIFDRSKDNVGTNVKG